MMLTGNMTVSFTELFELSDVTEVINTAKAADEVIKSAVGHESTALVLTALLGTSVPFARINLKLESGNRLLCVTPNFRASEAREFTKAEVEDAGWRAFLIEVL